MNKIELSCHDGSSFLVDILTIVIYDTCGVEIDYETT